MVMLWAARKEVLKMELKEKDETQPEVMILQHTSHELLAEVHSQLSIPRTTLHTVPVQA